MIFKSNLKSKHMYIKKTDLIINTRSQKIDIKRLTNGIIYWLDEFTNFPWEYKPDLPHISVQHSAWVEGGKAAAVGGLLRRVQLEWLWRTACTQPRSSRGGGKRRGRRRGQRIKGDLDYFGFSSFKSQHHLSNLMLDDFVEIRSHKSTLPKQFPAAFII